MTRTPIPWVFDDGGRAAAGFTGDTGDCVVRAITIASGLPYQQVYREMATRNADLLSRRRATRYTHTSKGTPRTASPREGSHRKAYEPWLLDLGFTWTSTMSVGSGTTVHLAAGELPATGRLIVRVSRHMCAVIDGVIHDTHDPSRDGSRAVYGYYTAPTIP